MISKHKQNVKRVLSLYFKLLADRTELGWDLDNEADMEFLVDEIIETSKEEILAAVRSHLLTYNVLRSDFIDQFKKEILEELRQEKDEIIISAVSDIHIGDLFDNPYWRERFSDAYSRKD